MCRRRKGVGEGRRVRREGGEEREEVKKREWGGIGHEKEMV